MKTTREKIEVMQAFEDGEDVQYGYCGETDTVWQNVPNPNWNWVDFDYRIKPKPKVIWVNESKSSLHSYAYNSEDDARYADESSSQPIARVAVKYIEALDDE